MSDWSHGYDVSTEYSYGFYREMGPDWLDLCAWIGGFDPPRRQGSFRYLDLGCGQGFGLCLLAAANPKAEFVGIDFQPEHIAHGQGLAEAAGLSNVRFIQADFLDLAADWPADLGTFEYVVLHGILSWVSPSLRDAVTTCLSHGTASGGLVYVSYNAHPGCLSTIPLQHLSQLIRKSSDKQGAAAVEASISLLDRLSAAGAPVFQVLPALKARVEALKGRDKNYLAHEYLTESWRPFWHSEVARQLRRAELDYVGSATMADNLTTEFLPPALHQAVTEQESAELRQDLQDLIINQAFRRDIYCRGATARGTRNSASKDTLPVYLAASVDRASTLSFATSFGQVSFDPAIFTPTIDALRNGAKSLAELFRLPNATPWQPRHILLLLLHANVLAPEAAEPGDIKIAQRLNAVIARAATENAPYEYLAAARLGSAIQANASDLALLRNWMESAGGISQSLPPAFLTDTLPRWQQLGVVE